MNKIKVSYLVRLISMKLLLLIEHIEDLLSVEIDLPP